MTFLDQLKGLASAASEEIGSMVMALPWDQFDPLTDLVPLREFLLALEQEAGRTTGSHRYAGSKIQAHLKLMNPAGHEAGITCFALKPDGKYLATGSWVGGDYDSGGHIMIWEVATGRPVQRIQVEGGTGWPDYAGTLQWHPELPLLGLAYDTNCVGVLDPFEDKWLLSSYITDGWSRPPAFCWTPNGDGLYVACWDQQAAHLDADDGPWNFPGVWVDLKTENCRGTGSGKTPWKDDLQPHKSCRPYGKHIVGVNNHGQLYASNPEKGIFWTKTAQEAWFGRHYFAYVDANELVVMHGAALEHAFRIPGVRPLHCALSDADRNPTVAVLEASMLAFYRGGKQLAKITLPNPAEEVAYDQPDLQKCSLSPNGEYCAVLDGAGHVMVWQVQNEPTMVLELDDEDAAGIFITDQGHLILAHEAYLRFVDPTGKKLAQYTFAQPEVESPLVVGGRDWGTSTLSGAPACPIQVGDTQQWALIFEEGAAVFPETVEADDCCALAAAGRFSWPLRWSRVLIYPSLEELCGNKGLSFSKEFLSQFGPKKSAAKAGASNEDKLPLGGKTYREDLLKEYERLLDGLGGSWQFAINDKYGVLAHYRMETEPQYDPLPLLKKIKGAGSAIVWTVQCAWWMLEKRKADVSAYLQLVRDRLPGLDQYEQAKASSMAGGLMVRLGAVEEGEALLKKGKAGIKSENNPGDAIAPYLRGLLLAGKPKEMLAALRNHDGNSFLDRSTGSLLTYSVISYADAATIEDYFQHFQEEGDLDDFEVLHWYAQWIVSAGLVEKISGIDDLFSGLSTLTTQLECAQSIYKNGLKEQAMIWFQEKLDDPEENESDYIDILFDLHKLEPEVAIQALLNPKFSAAKALKGLYSDQEEFMRKYLHLLAKHTKLTAEKYKEQFQKSLQPLWSCYGLLGVLDTLEMGDERWQPFLELGAQYAGKVKEDAFRPWTELSAKAFKAGFKDLGNEFKKQAKAAMGKSPGEFDLEATVEIYAEAGLFDEAYAMWLSINKSKRNHRMEGLCKALFAAGEYAAVLFMLERLEATDINYRPYSLARLFFGTNGTGYASLD